MATYSIKDHFYNLILFTVQFLTVDLAMANTIYFICRWYTLSTHPSLLQCINGSPWVHSIYSMIRVIITVAVLDSVASCRYYIIPSVRLSSSCFPFLQAIPPIPIPTHLYANTDTRSCIPDVINTNVQFSYN